MEYVCELLEDAYDTLLDLEDDHRTDYAPIRVLIEQAIYQASR